MKSIIKFFGEKITNIQKKEERIKRTDENTENCTEDLIKPSNEKGTVYLLIDCSGSMSARNKMEQAISGAIELLNGIILRDYSVGLISFNTNAHLDSEPVTDFQTLKKRIALMTPRGSTNMTDAIKLATEKLDDIANYKAIYIVTDGLPDNAESAILAAKEAKMRGIIINILGTDDDDMNFLKMIASEESRALYRESKELKEGIKEMIKFLPSGGKG